MFDMLPVQHLPDLFILRNLSSLWKAGSPLAHALKVIQAFSYGPPEGFRFILFICAYLVPGIIVSINRRMPAPTPLHTVARTVTTRNPHETPENATVYSAGIFAT